VGEKSLTFIFYKKERYNMIDKITVLGTYEAKGGTIIGGKPFLKGTCQEVHVDEVTFKRLQLANENGWFKIKSHNYQEFLEARGRAREAVVEAVPSKEVFALVENSSTESTQKKKKPAPPKAAEPTPVVEAVVEPVVEVVAEPPVVEVVAEAAAEPPVVVEDAK
jgi:hypothetical protein